MAETCRFYSRILRRFNLCMLFNFLIVVMISSSLCALVAATVLSLSSCSFTPHDTAEAAPMPGAKQKIDPQIAQGRYLVMVGGCNDCHTPGFNETGGTMPESEWLTGSSMGFRGPWGTTYPINLRLLINTMTENEWVEYARSTKGAPPMPWWALHSMEKPHLASIYKFIKSLGVKGELAPTAVPPDQTPSTPYISFAPVFPVKQ